MATPWLPEPPQPSEEPNQASGTSPQAELIAAKIKEATDWPQLTMAAAQQEQELQINRRRNPSPTCMVEPEEFPNKSPKPKTRRQGGQEGKPSPPSWHLVYDLSLCSLLSFPFL